jgi:MFS family permease
MGAAAAHRAPVAGDGLARRIFFGWWIALACGLGLGSGIATLVASTFGVYLAPLRAQFGWSAGDAFLATFVVTGVSALFAPIVGGVVDRFGARRVILSSFVATVLVLGSFGLMNGSLAGFYLRYALLGAVGLGTTHVAFARIISLWFDRRRGLALGVALAGVGVGGFLWPLLCQYVIAHAGWRSAYLVQSGVIALLCLPLLALVIRDTPQSLGLAADGEAAPGGAGSPSSIALPEPTHLGASFGAALHSPRYWLMLTAFLAVGLGVQSMMLHLVPLLTGRGISPMLAALAQALQFLALISGRLASGWLLDRFFAPRVAFVFLAAPIAGVVALALGAAGASAIACALLIGLAAGAEVDVIAYLTGRYFGLRRYSAIYGSFYGVYTMGGGLGGPLLARIAEGPHGYTPALWCNAALLAVAGLLLLRLGPFPAADSFPAED